MTGWRPWRAFSAMQLPSRNMGKRILRGVALLAVVAAPLATAADVPAKGTPQAAFEGFIAAFNGLDWPAFRSYLADEVSVFNPDIPDVPSLHRLDGRAAVEEAFRAVFAASAPGGPGIVPEQVRIESSGDMAVVSFEFRRSAASFGRRTLVFRRLNARWQIVHIHASNVSARP